MLLKTKEWQSEQLRDFADRRPWVAYCTVLNALDPRYVATVLAWAQDCMLYPVRLAENNPKLYSLLSQPWMQHNHTQGLGWTGLDWTQQPLRAQWDLSCTYEKGFDAEEPNHLPSQVCSAFIFASEQ